MESTICFDFGNTRLKGAHFVNGELADVINLEDGHPKTISQLLDRLQPQKSLLSSVIDHDPAIETILAARTRFHKLDHNSKIPITTPVGKPDTIGADRLAMLAAAVSLFPKRHNLVVGLGTAITYNFLNNQNQFLGGGISPGMELRFRSLKDFTAKLPLVEKDFNFPLVGYDTRTNILSGVIFGMLDEIDGTIDRYAKKYRNLNVLLTGGDSAYFGAHLKNEIFADLNLTFKGLYAISELNNA